MLKEETTVHPYELRAQPAKALLQRLYRDLSDLASEEVELAKVEIRERGATAIAALRGFVLSTACALVAMVSLAAFVVAALAYVVPIWVGALIVTVVYSVAALAIAAAARRRLAEGGESLRSTLGRLLGPPAGNATPEELQSRIERTRSHLDETLSALERKSDLMGPIRDTALGLGSLGVAMSAIVRNDSDG